MVRDPRDVAASWSDPTDAAPGVVAVRRQPPWKSAIVWSVVNACALDVGREIDSELVRFEDLLRMPDAVLEHVAEHVAGSESRERVEVGAAAAVTGPARRPEPGRPSSGFQDHSIAGDPGVRRRGTAIIDEAHVRCSVLSARDEIAVTSACLPLLARFGYPLKPSRGKSRWS
jgi:hypothetical protein